MNLRLLHGIHCVLQIFDLRRQDDNSTYRFVVAVIILGDEIQLVDEQFVLAIEPFGPILLLDSHGELVEPVLSLFGLLNIIQRVHGCFVLILRFAFVLHYCL